MNEPMVWSPKKIEDAWEIKQKYGSNARYISGGTWIQLRWESGEPVPRHLINLGNINEMSQIRLRTNGNGFSIIMGAASTLSACLNHPDIQKHWPIMVNALGGIASPAVRNQATIGGNLSFGYGDLIPALLVLDALVTWFDGKQYVTDKLINFLKNTNESSTLVSNLLTEILLPKAIVTTTFYKKIGRREAFSPSILTVAGTYKLNSNNEIDQPRLALGGGEELPHRLFLVEDMLQGQVPNDALWKRVHAKILELFEPCSDRFTSSQYRKEVAANLLIAGLSGSLV
ncbi:FAD binding domain-containing protein [Neobacillus sp. WH10]|uniref:FAD binding domain-containing protein n=1 Tax=Neobacillus sp. WH10 TaxID=3047873 RepID=UPI0024C15A5F|nr:FAD binding domain-containing protein [Neobacillus sp. WH10]WHY78653.1 FAD binding domain-containing protein [Neobacillus sp. WH10]